MKLLLLFGFVALANARSIETDVAPTFGYILKYAVPLADEIRKAEESMSKIVGGSTASLGQFPYQAGLLITVPGGTGVCGGSLINQRSVTTAAHCWFDGQTQGRAITVVLGATTIFTGGTRLNAQNIVMHPQWNPINTRNDVAVIRLNSVGFTATISPIALPSGAELSNTFAGATAVASGFGRISDNTPIANNQVLRHVTLRVITNAACTTRFPGLIQPSNICTDGSGGQSTCVGDSGGPLAATSGGRRVMIGITSFGSIRGCQAGFPAVFARVSSFVSFINQQA